MKTPRQINAERKQAGDPPLNFKLLRKVIKRIEATPESYAQQVWGEKAATFNADTKDIEYGNGGKIRPLPPCGTVACLAGETIICNAPSIKLGLLRLKHTQGGYGTLAGKMLGLSGYEVGLFDSDAQEWIEPFRTQFKDAKTYKGEARAAINYLKYIIATGKVNE